MSRILHLLRYAIATAGLLVGMAHANAQVPVLDEQNLQVATQTQQTTQDILANNKDILKNIESVLTAVTGNRASTAQGILATAAIGNGFSMAKAPDLGSLLTGGAFSWAGLPAGATQSVSQLINGLSLLQSLSGSLKSTGGDQLYSSGVSLTSALMGVASATQSASQSRVGQLQQAGALIGTSPDVKSAVDQNTQITVQSGLMQNELIGVVNGLLSSEASQRMQRLQAQSAEAQTMTYNSTVAAQAIGSRISVPEAAENATVEPRYAQ